MALANRVVAGARGAAAKARLELVAQRPAGPEPTFTTHDDETAEAAAVAARVQALLAGGTPASQVAILYRVNAQSEVYEAALADAGIPYVLRGAERFFERPEVRESVILLRGAARAGEESTGAAAVTTSPRSCRPRAGTRHPADRRRQQGALGVPGGARTPRRGPHGRAARRRPA